MGRTTNENKTSQSQAQWFQYRQTGIIATARNKAYQDARHPCTTVGV